MMDNGIKTGIHYTPIHKMQFTEEHVWDRKENASDLDKIIKLINKFSK